MFAAFGEGNTAENLSVTRANHFQDGIKTIVAVGPGIRCGNRPARVPSDISEHRVIVRPRQIPPVIERFLATPIRNQKPEIGRAESSPFLKSEFAR